MSSIFSSEIPELLQKHLDHLLSSAISLEVIRERGYRTVMGKKALQDTGFSPAQRRYPGILIPLHGPDGSAAGYQYRPDRPRELKDGKIVKYENPVSSSVRLDSPPRCRPQLGDPSVPCYFTEGVKKVDSLASAGVCAVGLTGVWGFKGKNMLGGTTLLADFDYITLKGRKCYLVFDSDLSSNPKVRQALDRLSEHLTRKGAMVSTIYIPPGPDGEKVGVDDYLTAGHALADLIKLEATRQEPASKPRARSSTIYDISDGRFVWVKNTSDGESEVPLCNFMARVEEDILRDNGLEAGRYFKISGKLASGYNLPLIETPASSFNSLNWITGEWGMRAVIAAGQAAKDRLREAIQLQSMDARQRTVYTHTGWREIGNDIYFLHGAGAMGRDDVEVELEPALKGYQLLQPVGDPVEAIKKSLNFTLVACPEVTFPLWSAMYLAPLSEIIDTAFTLWLVGASGSFKSTLTALALSHFGKFDSRHLPASWRDTSNQLEKLLFLCKDLPLVIDDWAPGQDSAKARDLEAKAEYIVRAQGNRQGRGRMRADTSSRPNYTPRGMLLTSGEQLPSGHSHTARILSIEIEKADVDTEFLCAAQDEQIYYCQAMANYLAWLKRNWQTLKATLPAKWRRYRDEFQQEQVHARMPETTASLYIALELVTAFAIDHGALTEPEAITYREAGIDIFRKLAVKQAGRVEYERPGIKFEETLSSMSNQGKIVFWSKDDDSPRTAVPGVTAVGWIDNSGEGESSILLNPKAAYGAVYEYCQHIGQPFTFKEEAVWKDMKRLGHIICDNGHNTMPIRIYGKLFRVVRLKKTLGLI